MSYIFTRHKFINLMLLIIFFVMNMLNAHAFENQKNVAQSSRHELRLKDLKERLARPNANWIQDSENGCKAFNPQPESGESIKYQGGCKDGLAHGEGKLEWFKDGLPNGVSTGSWIDGSENGHVVHVSKYGVFDLYIENGMRNGKATEVFKDGAKFIGEYKNDQKNGHGTFFRPDGVKLEGEFYKNRFMGYVPEISPEKSTPLTGVFFTLAKKITDKSNVLIESFAKVSLAFCLMAVGVGLIIGALLTNVISRFTLIKSFKLKGELPNFSYYKPIGYCPTCGAHLKWKNMIPLISYIFQKGSCHNCNAKIGLRYPIVEVLFSLIFFIAILTWEDPYRTIIISVAAGILVCIGVIGCREVDVPKEFSAVLMLLGVFASSISISTVTSEEAILGGFFGFLVPWLYNYCYRKQNSDENLLDPSSFRLFAAIGVWVGSIPITILVIFGLLANGLLRTVFSNIGFGLFNSYRPLICALGFLVIFIK